MTKHQRMTDFFIHLFISKQKKVDLKKHFKQLTTNIFSQQMSHLKLKLQLESLAQHLNLQKQKDFDFASQIFEHFIRMSFIGKLKLGTQVLVSNTNKFLDKKAVVKFVGKLDGKTEQFIGVELQTPDGTHAGTFEGKQYFKAKQNHGMFAKPKAVKLVDGSPLSNLLTVPQAATKTVPSKTVPPVAKQKAPTTKTSSGTTKKPADNKLSDQLKQAQSNQQLQSLREQLQEANLKIVSLQSTDAQQQLIAVRTRIRQLEDQNRMLQVQEEKAKLQSTETSQEKNKQLQQKIDFFNNQKEFHDKEKADLKKKIARLEEELQTYEGNLDEYEKLTFKMENLEAKNSKLKQQLQAAKTEVRNVQMLGGGSKQGQTKGEQLQEMKENIKILNETISLLEGDLSQEKQKSSNFQKELQNIKSKGGDITKLEKKLKSRDQELQALQAQLQASSDAAAFAEKLTLNLLRKQQSLKQSTLKLTQYLKKIQNLQVQISEAKQMIELQTIQLQTQEQQVQNYLKEKQQQQNHIVELNKQISKYKSKIAQLTQNNQSLLITNSQILDQTIGEDEIVMKTYINTDVYQHKYFQTLKTVQQLSQKYLESQLQSSTIKNMVGVQMLNLIETVPQSYTQQFYPDIIKIVIDLKSANDKLYLLFDTASSYMRTRNDIYSKENLEIAHWLVMLLEQIPLIYGQLTKIQLSLTTAENQEQIGDIVSNTILKGLIRKIDCYAAELLQRFAADNIDASIDMDSFIQPVQSLDKICGQGRKLQYEYQTRNKLCVQTMATIHKIFQSFVSFKETSDVGESAQVDTMIQNFLKSLLSYLRECCTNPQVRIKIQTKQYLSGIQFIITLLEQIEIAQLTSELSSLYSQNEDIKSLKQTIMTTQFYLKQLMNDLNNIVYANQLSKIKCNLPGKVWVDKAKLINTQLSRFHQLTSEKQELHSNLLQAKKKIIILEKQIKDRQSTKELYQKRIGQLQLKVEQASSLEKQNENYQQKIKSYEDTNKLIEDELQSQVNKRKQIQEQLKQLKEKLHHVQTQSTVGRARQKKTSIVNINAQEVTSLTIFKNVLNECHTLRTLDLKKKILQMKQSPLLAKMNPERDQKEKSVSNNPQTIRRKVLDTICDLSIIDPRKKGSKANNAQILLQSLQLQADALDFNRNNDIQKQEIVQMKIGSFFLKNNKKNDPITSRVNIGNVRVMSY